MGAEDPVDIVARFFSFSFSASSAEVEDSVNITAIFPAFSENDEFFLITPVTLKNNKLLMFIPRREMSNVFKKTLIYSSYIALF